MEKENSLNPNQNLNVQPNGEQNLDFVDCFADEFKNWQPDAWRNLRNFRDLTPDELARDDELAHWHEGQSLIDQVRDELLTNKDNWDKQITISKRALNQAFLRYHSSDRMAVIRALLYQVGYYLEGKATIVMEKEPREARRPYFLEAAFYYYKADQILGSISDHALRQAESLFGAGEYEEGQDILRSFFGYDVLILPRSAKGQFESQLVKEKEIKSSTTLGIFHPKGRKKH